LASKKRKLNNGDIVNDETKYSNGKPETNGYNYHHYSNQKSFSDGSDREMDEDLDEDGSIMSNDTLMNDDYDDEELNDDPMLQVKVQNKSYRLDRITPRLIKQMNENEKEHYINICRELYTEIYEM